MARILVGTAGGMHTIRPDGSRQPVQLEDRDVTTLAPEGWELWAVLDDDQVWHTAGIDWWFHVGDLPGLRGNWMADTRAGVVVGTSQARLFRVAGEGLEPVAAFDQIEGRSSWYTPWGGPPDTRSISEDGDTVYANVHVGGIVRSRDHGESWQPTIDIDADVHKVWATDGRVLAASARGLAISHDQGDSWRFDTDGLHSSYCRAVARCGDVLLITAADGPRGGHGAVYRRPLDGGAFERCRDGLPEWFEGNVDSSCLDAFDDLAAFAADGRVFASTDQGASWREVAADLPSIGCLRVLP